jgi:hypothetical protein
MRGMNVMLSLVIVMTASVTACSKTQSLGRPGIQVGGDRALPGAPVPGAEGSSVAASRKSVSGKEPRTTLIALDGSRCQVTERRYRETAIGEKVWCAWH